MTKTRAWKMTAGYWRVIRTRSSRPFRITLGFSAHEGDGDADPQPTRSMDLHEELDTGGWSDPWQGESNKVRMKKEVELPTFRCVEDDKEADWDPKVTLKFLKAYRKG